jgi:hypothetical protein
MSAELADGQIRTLLSALENYPNIPVALGKYIRQASGGEAHNDRLVNLLVRQDSRQILQRIDAMFQQACQTVNMESDRLGKVLSFSPMDTAPGQLESFFAVVRAINLLHEWGFQSITPLPREKSLKSADLGCQKDTTRCVVEVFNVYRDQPSFGGNVHLIAERFMRTAESKKPQVDASAMKIGAQKKIMLFILDSLGDQAFLVREDFVTVVKEVSRQLGWGGDYHFGISTGMQSSQGADDVLYPDF